MWQPLVEETWVVLHDAAEDCCSTEYSWIDTELCAALTTHALHRKYWADKSGKCYQDSVVPTEDLSVEFIILLKTAVLLGFLGSLKEPVWLQVVLIS
jgi:hypothetical protein